MPTRLRSYKDVVNFSNSKQLHAKSKDKNFLQKSKLDFSNLFTIFVQKSMGILLSLWGLLKLSLYLFIIYQILRYLYTNWQKFNKNHIPNSFTGTPKNQTETSKRNNNNIEKYVDFKEIKN